MRHRWALIAALCSLAALITAAILWHRWPPPQEQPAGGQTRTDPVLTTLLREPARNDRQHKSPFFTALASLARKHGANESEYVPVGIVRVDEGFAAAVGAGRVVVVLRGGSGFIPGEDTQYLLLLDQDGHLLDRLSCSISNRLTRMFVESGDFRSEVPEAPAPDGAHLVLRYVPEKGGSVSGNWSHEITHRGKTYHFHWDQGRPGTVPSADWAEKGLCRVAVREGTFAVLFPDLRQVDGGR